MAAAGDTTAKEDLLKGRKIGNNTYKVHLDGYDLGPALKGQAEWPRKEFIYWTDDGSVAALRYDAWLKRSNPEPFPVHVVVAQTDVAGEVVVELLPLEQQAKQEREERLMDQAAAGMNPVVDAFRDQVLFLKHNLNAQAVTALSGSTRELQQDITRLVADMEKSIKEADAFIASMQSTPPPAK